ncbi:mechanosensitive ion channel domain-containing protein [Eggerthellaceae bacterium 3-80]
MKHIESFIHSDWVGMVIGVVVIMGITLIVSRISTRFMRKVLHYNERKDLPSVSIFVNIVRGAVWVIGICVMLSTCFNVNISALLAALGVGGVAISLGLQSTLANLIAGLQVSLLRIIKPGDNITVSSSSGVVHDITWRHTTIRDTDNNKIIIPNSTINTNALTIHEPINDVSIDFVVTTDGSHLDAMADALAFEAGKALQGVCKVTKPVTVSYSGLLDDGFSGSVSFKIADSRDIDNAIDAVIRAIAPLTRASYDSDLMQQTRGEIAQAQAAKKECEKNHTCSSAEATKTSDSVSDQGKKHNVSWWKRVRLLHEGRKNHKKHHQE